MGGIDLNGAPRPKVVYLRNFLSPDSVAICQSWSRRDVDLVVLISVAMEGNRMWQATKGGMDVRVQKNWTITRQDQHPSGYRDVNYVHLPIDTTGQLRRIDPDFVATTEMGLRSILAAMHCIRTRVTRWRRGRCRLILTISTSPWIEASRTGLLRTAVRRWLLRRADAITYHGPQCRDYLLSLGAEAATLFPFNYAADPEKIYRGEILPVDAVDPDGYRQLRMLTVGQLIPRKGIVQGLKCLIAAAEQMPTLRIAWTVLGGGPLLDELKSIALPDNLRVDFRGNVDSAAIRAAYAEHELMFFPTRGDEWGLVVDEALCSGLVVIGNAYAQAVVTLVREGENGYVTRADDVASFLAAIVAYTSQGTGERLAMRRTARDSMTDRTPQHAADQIMKVIEHLEAIRKGI